MLEKRSTALVKLSMVLVRIPVLNAVPDAVLDMTLQDHLAAPVEGGLGRVDLGQNILTGDVLVNHPINGLHLSDNFLQPAVQIVGVHTLSHSHSLHTIRGMSKLYLRAPVLSISVF